MKKTVAIGALSGSALLIAGCAVPVPVQMASWALDGISYLMTEKSMSDHGLSVVAQKDCAIWRGVTAGELCRDWDGGDGTLVADSAASSDRQARPPLRTGFAPAASSDIPPLETTIDDGLPNIEALTNFVTAAGTPAVPTPSVTRPMLAVVPVGTNNVPGKPYRQKVAMTAPRLPAAALAPKLTLKLAIAKQPVPQPKRSIEPAAGVYFVIGSFRNYLNAQSLADRHGALAPAVLAAKLDGAPVYRVVVGPAVSGAEKALHVRLSRAGLADTWAIRVAPGDWTIARAVIDRKRRIGIGREMAELPR